MSAELPNDIQGLVAYEQTTTPWLWLGLCGVLGAVICLVWWWNRCRKKTLLLRKTREECLWEEFLPPPEQWSQETAVSYFVLLARCLRGFLSLYTLIPAEGLTLAEITKMFASDDQLDSEQQKRVLNVLLMADNVIYAAGLPARAQAEQAYDETKALAVSLRDRGKS